MPLWRERWRGGGKKAEGDTGGQKKQQDPNHWLNEDEKLSAYRAYRNKRPQELRHALSQQIHKEVFFATLMSKAQSSINSSALLKALQVLAWDDEQAA